MNKAEAENRMERRSDIGTFEQILVHMDAGVFGVLWRVAIGFAAIPAMVRVLGDGGSDWRVAPFLLSTLLLVRVVAAATRWTVHFTEMARTVWAQRREMAKRYDSYQWRKLFWIGIGIALYVMSSGEWLRSYVVVFLFCIAAGMLGILRWRVVDPRRHGLASIAGREHRAA